MDHNEERALAPIEEKKPPMGYWARVSHAYAAVFHALIFVLPLFVIVFMAICAQAFTRNSVFGFGNDLLSVSSFLSSDYNTVCFPFEEGERTVLTYRDGVAAVTPSGIKVYSPDGERLLSKEMSFGAPRAVASAKYLVAYDFGSTSFAVTNGYSVLFEGQTEHPILDAAVADTGHFALITAAQTHLSQVLLYDANFNLIQRFSRSSATTDVALSSNGKYVAFCGIATENGTAQSVAELYRIGAKEPSFSIRKDEVALALSFTDARHLMLITPGEGYLLDLDGEQLERIDFGGTLLASYRVNENGCVFLLDSDTVHAKSRVLACDKRGSLLYEKELDVDLSAVTMDERYVYMLGDGVLLRASLNSDRVDELVISAGAEGILLSDEGQLRLLYAGAAEFVEFD
jgi:hypothetical protein